MVAFCLIFISQWAVKAWIIANFTIPAMCLKLKKSKNQSVYFFLQHPVYEYNILGQKREKQEIAWKSSTGKYNPAWVVLVVKTVDILQPEVVQSLT